MQRTAGYVFSNNLLHSQNLLVNSLSFLKPVETSFSNRKLIHNWLLSEPVQNNEDLFYQKSISSTETKRLSTIEMKSSKHAGDVSSKKYLELPTLDIKI